jgi:SSS family solute:Na+ symporter
MLAMRKLVTALGVFDGLPPLPGDERLWAILPILVIVVIYTAASGLWGVVTTDFLQYILSMVGAFLVMFYALAEVGGLGGLTAALRESGQGDKLNLLPTGSDATLPISTFFGYLFVQWWAFRNSDGGGMFVQRLSSTATEKDATKAAHLFNILNYVVRTWPWVLVALAALVVLPNLADPELAYPIMMIRYLPTGVLGLVFASLVAAFMSSVSTQVNWGASYLVNDLYARFTGEQDEARLMRAARWASVMLATLAGVVSFFMDSVGGVFRFAILIGTGPGLVLLLRWFWWRINAWAEIAAMAAGLVLAILSYTSIFTTITFGQRLMLSAFGAMAVWVPVMYLTAPESTATLDAFYTRVRPAGAWGPVRARTNLTALDDGVRDARRWLGWSIAILGGTLLIGWVILF